LIVLIVWMYYSAQVFLLGAEFTHVYAHARGSRRNAAATVASASAGHDCEAAVERSRAALAAALRGKR
jgi:membrane protein